MHALKFALMAFVALGLLEFIRAAVANRGRRAYDHRLRAERIRTKFAKARTQLLRLARCGEVDAGSFSFRVLYWTQTFFLRRPDKYAEIGSLLFHAVGAEDSADAAQLAAEAKLWTHELKHVAKDTADGLAMVVLSHSWLMRLIVEVERRSGAVSGVMNVMAPLLNALLRFLKRCEKRSEASPHRATSERIVELHEAQAAMERLAA